MLTLQPPDCFVSPLTKIMDSSNWQMLDTYQLDDDEYGMSMKFMTLSDVSISVWK